MGLPLFTPPVESDVPPKCAAKRAADSSYARTPIGRLERSLNRRRQFNETRETRLRMLAAFQATEARAWPARSAWRRSSTNRSNARPVDAQHAPVPARQMQIPRASASDLARSSSRTPETQWPQPFTPDTLITFNDSFDDAIIPHLVAPLASPPFRYRPLGHNTSAFSGHSISARGANAESRRRIMSPDRLDDFGDEEGRHGPIIVSERYITANPPNPVQAHRQRVRYVDGLGDRDRSLSPEGDGVWDTLQSTLTPDPQPPSVNSSFTSTVISTAAPHSNGPNSVHTSMTTPNEEADPPCDPVIDGLGSDGEDDYGSRYVETQRPTSQFRMQRSYADVVADLQSRQSPESADMGDPEEEWLSGMHRIVRGLVSRDDIPDEWWARAGLSRSMSWEDST